MKGLFSRVSSFFSGMRRFGLLLGAAVWTGGVFPAAGGEFFRPADSLFQVEEFPFKLAAAHPGWRGVTTQNSETLRFPGEGPELRDGFEVRRGTFQIGSYGSLVLEEGKKGAGNEMEVRLNLESGKPFGIQLLFVTTSIPFSAGEDFRFRVNGRWNRFSEYYSPSRPWQINIPNRAEGNRIEIPLRRGLLIFSGHFQAMFQDNRKFNSKNASFRIIVSPSESGKGKWSLAFRAEYKPYPSFPVTFEKKGRGAEQKSLSPGIHTLGGVRFSVSGAALEKKRNLVPESGVRGRWWYLLCAGAEELSLELTLADGKREKLRLLTNAPFGEDDSDSLRCLIFQSEGKEAKSVRIDGSGKTLPLALSVSQDRIVPRIEARPLVIRQGREWKVVDLKKDVIPGSALDFSGLLDAPAGKYGFVKTAGENFEFERRPGVPVRFWGLNVTHKVQFMSNEEIDRMTARFAANGFNLVRFHHFDNFLQKEGAEDTTSFDPAKLDRLDYFFASCKRRGIYITLDLYTSRKLKKGEIRKFPDRSVSGRDFKALALIDEEVMQNLERFAGNLLTHTNPYTNLRWADDPALVTVSIINEGTLSNNLRSSYVRKVYDDAFRKFRSESDENRTVDRQEFERRVYANAYSRYSSRLRKWGVRVPLSDLNYIMDPQSNLCRSSLDYVDLHYYWAHPTSDMPRSASPDDALGALGGISLLFPHRAFGRPFAITEWNYVFPNAYRAEGGFLAGAYAALQNYAMLCQFDYASNPVRSIGPAHIVGFELANDPIARLTNLAGALFFLRGDVSPSDKRFAYRIVPEDANRQNSSPDSFRELGLIAQSGYFLNDPPKGATVVSASQATLDKLRKRGWITAREGGSDGIRRSSSGELEMNLFERTFSVVTPRSEGFVGRAGTVLRGKNVSGRIDGTFASILVASCGKTELAESRRILILHLTDCLNSGLRFTSGERHSVDRFGGLPVLVRKGEAEISLRSRLSGGAELHALDLSGKRIRTLPVERREGRLHFRLDNSSGVFAYELLLKE